MELSDPCPFCRKAITGYELGKWSNLTGAAELWPTSLKNLSVLACGEGFNEYFRDPFNGNEVTYLRWKKVFDALGIQGGKGESIETQVWRLRIRRIWLSSGRWRSGAVRNFRRCVT